MHSDNPKPAKATSPIRLPALNRFVDAMNSAKKNPNGTNAATLNSISIRFSLPPCKSRYHSASKSKPVFRAPSTPMRFNANASRRYRPMKTTSPNAIVENPLEIDPLVTPLFDPLPFSFSSKNEMQADEMKNRSSLHSI